jgi:xylan 1,4-beta-xylosidase
MKDGVRDRPDVAALASRDDRKLTVLAWHYHDDDVAGSAAAVTLTIAGLAVTPERARLRHFRIDAEHSNAHTAWRRMGSPQAPTPAQYAQLEQAGRLQTLDPAKTTLAASDQAAEIKFALPRQGVSLIVLEW